MIGAIFLAIIVTLLVAMMDRLFMGKGIRREVTDENGKTKKEFSLEDWGDTDAWPNAIAIGVGVGAAKFVVTHLNQLAFLSPLALIAMVGVMFYLAWWWGGVGMGWRAYICFWILEGICSWVAGLAVTQTLTIPVVSASTILKWFVNVLPNVAYNCAVWSAIVGICRREEKKGLATILTIVAVILILITCWTTWSYSGRATSTVSVEAGVSTEGTGNLWEDFKQRLADKGGTSEAAVAATPVPQPTPVPTPAATPTPVPQYGNQYGGNQYGQYGQYGQIVEWWTFYNLTIQNDGLASNDNDFGPNPYRGDWWINEYVEDMLARIRKDPVLGAADIAYFDHIAGTEISGVKYDSNAQKWLDNINARAVEFVKDQNLYVKVVDEFIRAINNSNIVQKIEIKSRKDIKGLMYMEPNNTVNLGVSGYGYGYGYGNYVNNYGGYSIKMPKVIWKSHNEEAYFLIYTVKKANSGTTSEALYKLACGYQPPIEGTGYGGINAGGNSGSNPGPGPNPSYVKDPTKGTNVGRNDVTGPGPDTNNGVGAQTSKVDLPTNSGSMSSVSEYKEAIQEIASANEHQTPGDNKPSTATPAGAEVSNNADKGTGYGGIDAGTTVTAPVTIASTGQQITSTAAGEWGGPSD